MRTMMLMVGGVACLATALIASSGVEADPNLPCCKTMLLEGMADPTTAPAAKADAAKVDARAAFAQLSKLVGHWKSVPSKDQPDLKGTTEFKLTAAGSVLMETMMPGTAMEMVNLYALDGDDLLVTHYCAAGNQPRMKLVGMADGSYTFALKDVTNLSSPDDSYMGGLKLTVAEGTLVADWTNFEKGKPSAPFTIHMARE